MAHALESCWDSRRESACSSARNDMRNEIWLLPILEWFISNLTNGNGFYTFRGFRMQSNGYSNRWDLSLETDFWLEWTAVIDIATAIAVWIPTESNFVDTRTESRSPQKPAVTSLPCAKSQAELKCDWIRALFVDSLQSITDANDIKPDKESIRLPRTSLPFNESTTRWSTTTKRLHVPDNFQLKFCHIGITWYWIWAYFILF